MVYNMTMRQGKEFLDWIVPGERDDTEPPIISYDWRIVLDSDIAALDCEHQTIEATEYGDSRITPRAVEARADDPYETGVVCLDCLLDALRQLGIMPL